LDIFESHPLGGANELEPFDASDLNASRSFDIEFPLEKLPPIMFQDMCLSGIPPTSTVPFRTKK